MRYLAGFVFFLLALGTLRVVGCGDASPCGNCDDGNPCTMDTCAKTTTYAPITHATTLMGYASSRPRCVTTVIGAP